MDREYIFPDPTRPQWYVVHSHSTGSSWDGTRAHSWRAVQLNRVARSANVPRLYDSREDAEQVATEMTLANVEP